MNHLPCHQRLFPLPIRAISFYPAYLHWLSHLSERLGTPAALAIWQEAFADYDETYLLEILSGGWRPVATDDEEDEESRISALVAEYFPASHPGLPAAEARAIIENTPPIPQVHWLCSSSTVERVSTAYEALHLRFAGLAHLAETLVKIYGKQGELIVYDLMLASRLAVSGKTGTVEAFIEDFTAQPAEPTLFTAGLEIEVVCKSAREAEVDIHQCEWARYFNDHHPQVGYLMACSTDEAAYKAFNKNLRMQRTQTLMEGGVKCDFKIYALPLPPIDSLR